MKIVIKTLIILLVVSITTTKLQAQTGPKHGPTFSGEFKYEKKELPASLLIWSYPNNNMWDTATDYSIKIGSDNRFSFTFPSITKPLSYDLKYKKKGIVIQMGKFYVEPNDDIHIEIFERQIKTGWHEDKDSVVFSGSGSAKYNLLETLNKEFPKFFDARGKQPKDFASVDSLNSYLTKLYRITNQFIEKKKALINNYTGVNADMKKIISYHQYGMYDRMWSDEVLRIYHLYKNDEIIQAKIKQYYNNHYKEIEASVVNPDYLSIFCPVFYQLSNGTLIDMELINSTTGLVNFKDHYDLVKNNYKGAVREQFLSEILKGAYGTFGLSNITPVIYDSIVVDAAKYLTSDQGKDIIAEKLTFKNGSQFYDADFIDMNGQVFNTASLRGKVFIVDVWGLGCSACAGFHTLFEQNLWPVLKDYKDFVFLATFMGKTRESWTQGIESKLYTSKEYMNIASLPLGADHPFFKNYKINYAPCFLLVDKNGKIIQQFRPDKDPKELLKLIDAALKESVGVNAN